MVDKTIIDFLLEKSNFSISNSERIETYNTVSDLIDKQLITEKNLSFKSADNNYNFGNYFINKDKESESSMTSISDKFKSQYLNETEKEVFAFLKKKNLNNEMFNKYICLYNTFISKRIKQNKEIPMKDILSDYIIQ